METSVIGLDVVAALHREYDQLPESEAHKKYVEFRNIVKSAARKATTQEASRLWKLHEELKKTKQEIEREKKMKIETGCLPECPLPGNDFHVLNGIATCDHCGSKWQLDTSRRCKEEEFIATILYARPSYPAPTSATFFDGGENRELNFFGPDCEKRAIEMAKRLGYVLYYGVGNDGPDKNWVPAEGGWPDLKKRRKEK